GIQGGSGRRPTGLSRSSRQAVVGPARVRLEMGGWLRLKSRRPPERALDLVRHHPVRTAPRKATPERTTATRPSDLHRETADHLPRAGLRSTALPTGGRGRCDGVSIPAAARGTRSGGTPTAGCCCAPPAWDGRSWGPTARGR